MTTLASRVLTTSEAATNVLIGYIAGHFATSDTLSAADLARYLDESEAVTK